MKHVLAGIAFVAAFVFFSRNTNVSGPFTYDEADYMFAAGQGLSANFVDSPTMPISAFISTGLQRGRNSTQRAALSQSIRSSNDIVFYRHWHGPLFYYWLCALDRLHLSEGTVRRASLAFFILIGIAIYAGALWIVQGAAGFLTAVLGLAMFLWGRTVLGSPELAPHALFALCSLVSLLSLVMVVKTGSRAYWFSGVIAAAAAFATMEMALVLILTLMICGFLERRRLRANAWFVVQSALSFLVTVGLLW